MIEVRYATQADANEYYNGKYPHRTFKGVAVVEDGKTIILGGVYRDKVNQIAFTDMKVDPTKYKRHIIKATRLVMGIIEQFHHVYAIIGETSPPGAGDYIRHYGFEGYGIVQGREVFIWRNKNGNDKKCPVNRGTNLWSIILC